MLEAVGRVLGPFFQTKTTQLAMTALIITLIVTGILAFLLSSAISWGSQAGTQHGGSFIIALGEGYRIGLAVFFVLFFMFIWFLLYVQYVREAEDVYSLLRDKIAGVWIATYDVLDGEERLDVGPNSIGCQIRVRPDNRKLEMVFTVMSNRLYRDSEQIISAVALRHDSGNRYMLMYYYEGEREIDPEFSYHLLDGDARRMTQVPIEIYGIVYFDIADSKEIKMMSGSWYDLNGNVIRMFAAYRTLNEQKRAGVEGFKVKLSDVSIHQGNFSANMGHIRYHR